MKNKLLATILCVTFATVLITGCDKIKPGTFSPVEKMPFAPSQTAMAEIRETDQIYEAVGTIRPKTESRIEARVTGQVLSVQVKSGDQVAQGDLLVALDARQMESRMGQAKQALKTAEAGREQARHAVDAARASLKQAQANYNRIKGYYDNQAATAQELENAEAGFRQAQAGVKKAKEGLAAAEAGVLQAREVLNESKISLAYTRILAPENGFVLKRLVEPGDLALPGKPLITLRTSGALRLEAYVREGLISKVAAGSRLDVEIETLHQVAPAVVEEIVPYADPNSRTFLVKAALPPIENLFPGMFGTLKIPVGRHRVVSTPWKAVRRVGQLELITVKTDGGWETRHVKTGSRLPNGDVEILSGLNGDETVGWEGSNNG